METEMKMMLELKSHRIYWFCRPEKELQKGAQNMMYFVQRRIQIELSDLMNKLASNCYCTESDASQYLCAFKSAAFLIKMLLN